MDDFNDIEDSVRKANLEEERLASDQRMNSKITVQIEEQRLWMRRCVFWCSWIVVVLICILEIFVVCILLTDNGHPVAFTLLAITPVVSVTFITIAILISTFQRNQKKEPSSIPLAQFAKLFSTMQNGS